MRIKEILSQITHRQWDVPQSNWKFYQEWNNTIYLHWQVEIKELQQFVPEEIEIDLFEGKAWVSLVAFTMEKIRPKYLPYFPPVSNFDEINIRTYVKYKGKPGVYFLSIEGGKSISCKVAKLISELPYRYSNINRKENSYTSKNNNTNDRFSIEFEVKEALFNKQPIDIWLTERYALFQETKKAINQFEIHHIEWPIQNLEIKNIKIDYARFKNLFSSTPYKIGYSKGVQVIAWGKEIDNRN